MTTIFNKPLLVLMGIIMSVGVITSCKKNNDSSSSQTQLYSFGPTGAKHGDTLRFIGNNLTTVTEIDFTGKGAVVAKSAFVKQTSDLIQVVVPASAEQGFVTLKTPQGDIVTKTKLNLDVTTMVTSMTAEARPGENITINGQFLNWVTRVTFAKGKAVDTFVSQSISQLVVKVPADAQTGTLIISYAGTDPKDLETKDTLKVTLPVVSALTPNPVLHKTNLTIAGTNLDLATKIIFNGLLAPTTVTSFVSQSANQIVVTVPSSTTKGTITLVAASGVMVQSPQTLDVLLPSISSISPNPIDTGANLTIKGANLTLVSGVSFVGVAKQVTSFVSQTDTQLVVKVPAGSLKGQLTFAVKNSTLTVTSTDNLVINGGLPPLADFAYPIYTDALQNGFQDWSYTDTHDFNNTSNVRQGTKSILAVYATGGYQGLTFHEAGTIPSTAGYSTLEISVFGEPGTGGKKLNVVINGDYSHVLQQITVVEGEWATFSLSLSSLGSPATLNEIVLQSAGWGGTIHIDHVGLR